jgi:hypothetical protein
LDATKATRFIRLTVFGEDPATARRLAGPLTRGHNDPPVAGDASADVAREAIPIDGRTDAVVDVSNALAHHEPGRAAALTPTEWGR